MSKKKSARRKEEQEVKLTEKLQELTAKRNWAEEQVNHNWAKAKEHESEGRMEMA